MQTHADSFIPFLPLNAMITFLIAVIATSDRSNFNGGKVYFGPWFQGVSLLFVGRHGRTAPWNGDCVAEHLRHGGPRIKGFEASHLMSSVYRREAASKGPIAFRRSTTFCWDPRVQSHESLGDSLISNHKYKGNKGFPGFGNFLELSQAGKPGIVIPLFGFVVYMGIGQSACLSWTPQWLIPMCTNFNTNLPCIWLPAQQALCLSHPPPLLWI